MENKKRVYCLYRVSTLGQVDKDDIPVQKQACREFAERQGWEVVKEFYEKGISGFKVSSTKRDAILEIQREAALGNFDILLVFMFDRLGRRDDETPFVVEWFIRNNVAVWSVNEGEQRLDSHVDKLLNYIRYWQASGESIKTSIRCKAGIAQIVQEGYYPGGPVPFGYSLEKSGQVNKRGKDIQRYTIYDEAAEMVKTLFSKYVNEGYGCKRIADFMYDHGVTKYNGRAFTMVNIYTMLKNELYIGILKRGETQTAVPHLQIIDEDTFYRAQELRKMRDKLNNDRRIPMTTKGQSLLSGNIICGHCGRRMTFSPDTNRYSKKSGEVVSYNVAGYVCKYGSTIGGSICQKKYIAKRVDDTIRSILQQVFAQIRELPPADTWERQHERQLSEIKNKVKTATRIASKLDKELSAYKSEILKVINGDSTFTAEILSQLIGETEEKISKQTAEIDRLTDELNESDALFEKIKGEHMRIRSWSEIFDDSSIETQKMVTASLIREVRISRGYHMEIDFNISAKEFLDGISFINENLNVSIEGEKKEIEGRICPKCGSEDNQTNQGRNRYSEQRHKCNSCNYTYTLDSKRKAHKDEVRQKAINAYYSGVSVREMGVLFGVKKSSVYRWLKNETTAEN